MNNKIRYANLIFVIRGEKVKLTKRLNTIADLVNRNSIVADVGTDHGYIPKYLIEKEIAKLVIATDISKGSLEKTINYIKEEDLSEYIITRLGNGLQPIKPFEVDTVIIAGMGGLLIVDILEESKDKLDTYLDYILQPMVGADELRKYLLNNGFKIINDKVVREGDKFYEIIHAIRGLEIVKNEVDYEISPLWFEDGDKTWKEMMESRLSILKSVKYDLKDRDSEKSRDRLIEINDKIKIYQEVLGVED